MALAIHADVDLQSLSRSLLTTQRELSGATEIICQLDDLADFAHDVELHDAMARLAVIRQQMEQVCTVLRLRMTIQMMQLATRFQQHFRRQFRIPIANLDLR
jgi:hypothetical protein